MASNNNDNSGTYAAIGMIGALAWGMFVFAFVLFAFLAVLMTVVAVVALFRPVPFFGNVITRDMAVDFLYRGWMGACLLVLFTTFSAFLLGFDIKDGWWGYILLAGYTMGSVGWEMLQADQPAPPPTERQSVMIDAAPAEPAPSSPVPNGQPFRFASWDDEEELKR